MVGSGSVITKDVPAYGLVVGNPARMIGFVCPCGVKLIKKEAREFYNIKKLWGDATSIEVFDPELRKKTAKPKTKTVGKTISKTAEKTTTRKKTTK